MTAGGSQSRPPLRPQAGKPRQVNQKATDSNRNLSFSTKSTIWVGEIVFDEEIPFGDEIRHDGGWVDLISSESKPKISSASADLILVQARIYLFMQSVIPNVNIRCLSENP